uniref:DNA polymerase III subunit n=1 Tax=Alistipes sp. TaxID=1872444 RepID=UPI004056E96D
MRFSDIVGQEELKRHLVRCADEGRVSHAQLFTGAAGRGVLPLALAYVQYLNCPNRKDGDSCGVCPTCQQLASLAHPDLHWVLPVNKQGKRSGEVILSDDFLAEFRRLFAECGGYFSPEMWFDRLNLGKTLQPLISAKEADRVIEKLSLKSFSANYKCVMIWLPEWMNEEAANKLLKILEEPWPRTLFLLLSERPDRLLQTILSRTQELHVGRIEVEVLCREALACGVTEHETALRMARLSEGDLLELRALANGEQREERKQSFDLFCSLMRLSYNDKHLELIDWAEEAAQLSRERQRSLLKDAARLLRESYMLHAGLGQISYLWGEEEAFCRKFYPFIGNENIEPLIAEIEAALRQLGQNGNPTIVFTHFALSVSKMINKLK